MEDKYDINIYSEPSDSLERVMAQIYTDLLNPILEDEARTAFQRLIHLFNDRLASTTNNIPATQQRLLYRILGYYIGEERVEPKNLTIVTFNQDLQAEKFLDRMATTPRWRSHAPEIFCFPHLYQLDLDWENISGPRDESESFPLHEPVSGAIKLLKLHGSLNWYSTHSRPDVPPKTMFRQLARFGSLDAAASILT